MPTNLTSVNRWLRGQEPGCQVHLQRPRWQNGRTQVCSGQGHPDLPLNRDDPFQDPHS